MSVAQAADSVYALLADGSTIEIRLAVPADFDAVKAMYEAMSPDNIYLRFFGLSRRAAEDEAQRTCRDTGPGRVALLALADGVVLGCASYYTLREPVEPGDQAGCSTGGTAEIAFAVADHMHHRGIATLLLEHLVSFAVSHQIRTFSAEVLAENTAMLRVVTDAGLPVRRHYAGGVIELMFPLPREDAGTALDTYLDAVAARERSSDAASLRHVFAPGSVAVIGASRRPGTVGRAILDNIATGGYRGRIYAVNPHVAAIGDIPCSPAVADLPEPPDLAVIAVPAAAVLDTVEQCGRRGVRSVVVITSGLDAAACADLLSACRRHGMRLVGPNCFGVAVPGIGLDATFAASHLRPGPVGLVSQSGGLGFAMVDQLSRLGLGISSFASVGNKLDVSSNDLLLWWEQDEVTKLAVLYIESFGNPRKFARTARRVGAVMPVLTVLAGRSPAGQHPGTGSAPLRLGREALFEQAGVITTRGFGELIEATALLASQPVPAGRTVAIVSNVGSAGLLAADACTDRGLTVHRGPVDMTATVCGEDFRQCLELLAADQEVDALIAVVLPTGATGDLVQAVQQADVGIPLAVVVLNQPESVRLLPRPAGGQVPAYGYPEAAVAALARAATYGAWRAEPRGRVHDFPDIKTAKARALTREFLGQAPQGGWLAPHQAADLLRCYGIPLADGEGDCTETAARADGVEVIVRVAADHTFGPLVMFGLGGVDPRTSEVFADSSARLTPLTDLDADELIHCIRSAPLLLGYRGAAAADLDALREMLLRVSRLADDLPEITDLDLNPVIARPDGVFAVDARVKVAPYQSQDPFLRELR